MPPPAPSSDLRGFSRRASEVSGLLEAIDLGELLAATPEDALARVRHETGLVLLAIAQERARALAAELATAATD